MFTTYEPFKFPIQLGDNSTIWSAVEIALNVPWLLATLEDDEEVPRTLLLRGTDDLLQVVQLPELGRLTGLHLVLPPNASPNSDWSFVAVSRVERELRSIDGSIPSAVLTSREGHRYGGFPLAPTDRDESDLVLLVDLPMSAM